MIQAPSVWNDFLKAIAEETKEPLLKWLMENESTPVFCPVNGNEHSQQFVVFFDKAKLSYLSVTRYRSTKSITLYFGKETGPTRIMRTIINDQVTEMVNDIIEQMKTEIHRLLLGRLAILVMLETNERIILNRLAHTKKFHARFEASKKTISFFLGNDLIVLIDKRKSNGRIQYTVYNKKENELISYGYMDGPVRDIVSREYERISRHIESQYDSEVTS